MKFHELVEASESVTERCVLDSLFIGDHEVVQSKETLHTVNEKVTIAWNAAHGVAEQRQMNDLRNRN